MESEININEILLEVAESINELRRPNNDKKYISVVEASKRYNVSASLFRKWIFKNEITTYRIGKLVRLNPLDIERMIKPTLKK